MNQKRKIIHPKFAEKDILVIEVDEMQKLNVEIINDDFGENVEIQYSCEDEDIISINQAGIIKGLRPGKTTVHAYVYGKSCFLTVKVIEQIKKGKLLFVGHRGVGHLAPENTMESFQLAIDNQFDFVETDIRITKDKQMVLHHDKTLKRLFGRKEYIKDCTLKELKSLSFINGYCLDEFPNAKIATFEEFLELVSKNSQIRPIIELKDESLCKENQEFLDKINQLIYQYHIENRVRVISAIKPNIEMFRNINQDVDMGYICEDENFEDIAYLKKHHFMLCWKYVKCNQKMLEILHNEHIDVDLWIIDDKELCADLMDWPITSVTSNIVLFHYD